MPTPKYERVATTIRARIKAGEYKPGDQIPTYRKLIEEFGVSYGSVRSAIMLLKSEQLLEGRQGEGLYVKNTCG